MTDENQTPKKPKKKEPKLVQMKHRQTGHSAYVHPDMVEEYRKGEYEVVN